MPTLILTPRYTEDSQALWRVAGQAGWNVERLTSWRIPEHLRELEEPVLYGEALFGPLLAEQLGLSLHNPPEDWLVRLPSQYKKRDIQLTTLGEARQIQTRQFIKPPNDKSFPARIYCGAELPTEYPEEMSVLVSEVVEWENEFRCFILDRELCTFSIYAPNFELRRETNFTCTEVETNEVRRFMTDLLSDQAVDLPRATVIDVGQIKGRGWACIEQNAAWGSGIYGCDPVKALEVIRYASTKTSKSLI